MTGTKNEASHQIMADCDDLAVFFKTGNKLKNTKILCDIGVIV